MLAIDPGDVEPPSTWPGVTASVAADGQSIDVASRAEPERQSFSFTYKINNGKAPQKSQAKVTVTLAPDEVNTPPTLRPGTATLARDDLPASTAASSCRCRSSATGATPRATRSASRRSSEGSSVDGLGRLNVLAAA